MNSRSALIVSIVFLSVLLNVYPCSSCLKKIRTLIRNRGKEEKPAELARDEASFIKYSHATRNNFYIEIIQNANKSFVVRELDHPPIALNQVVGDDIQLPTMEPSSREPDAEYIDLNDTTVDGKSEVMPVEAIEATSEAAELLPKDAVEGEEGEDEEEEEFLTPEDEIVRSEWGGKCKTVDWERCNKIRQIVVLDVIHTPFQRKNLDLDCLLEPILCLRNGWTSTRCHILCMAAQCNKDLFFDWDGTVDFEGPCRYRK